MNEHNDRDPVSETQTSINPVEAGISFWGVLLNHGVKQGQTMTKYTTEGGHKYNKLSHR